MNWGTKMIEKGSGDTNRYFSVIKLKLNKLVYLSVLICKK
jgi:hypothetical protein